MESAQQDFSGANRSQRRQSESLQNARSAGLCDNAVNALKLWANQQKDGDSPIAL